MVSFQCNHCADILTKPKLDKHRAGCRASFDCIDCGRHFETPADYKGHTSCITEAEKHQKTLYNGGKQSGPERNGGNQRSWQQGGGRQWGDNRQRWQQQNVNRATGANITPLGTPARMSPVNDTPVVEEDSRKMQPTAETTRKRKVETETTESKGTSKSAEKRRKKQKTVEDTQETTQAEVMEVGSKTERRPIPEVTIPKRPPHDANIQLAENGNALQEVDEKKKKKKKKTEAEEDVKGVKKEKKRKKKEGASPSGEELGSVVMVDTKATVEAPLQANEVPSETNPEKARSSKKSKSKSKSKVKVPTADETPVVTTVAEVAGIARSDPGGNRKKKGHSDDHEDEGDAKLVAQDTSKEKRKEKKKKRKSEG